jgi:thymidylate synthase
MKQYQSLLKEIIETGDVMYEPRTEELTIGLAGAQRVFDLEKGFPLVTTKNVGSRWPFEELLWKLRGEMSVKSLHDKGIDIWDANAFDHYLKKEKLTVEIPKHSEAWESEFRVYKKKLDDGTEEGDLGPVYGYQWRHGFKREDKEIDQLKSVIDKIKKNPGSRYHLMTAWNPSDLPDSALGPCPMLHQFSVFGNYLDLQVYQRSCDTFLGVPFNIAQDSLLNHLVAKETGLKARKFIHTYGNVHIYLGVGNRAEFWKDENNVKDFKDKIKKINTKTPKVAYLDTLDWYLEKAGEEEEINNDKDHIPKVLELLSKRPRKLPTIELKDVEFWDAINLEAKEIVSVKGYNPHVWNSKARMAV